MKPLIHIFFIAIISACSSSNEYAGKKVIVYEDTKAYIYPEETNEKINFVFTKNDKCIFTGNEITKKAFEYDEIDCLNKGKAWIMKGTGRF